MPEITSPGTGTRRDAESPAGTAWRGFYGHRRRVRSDVHEFIGELIVEIGKAEVVESRLRERIELLKAENRELWTRIEEKA
jgi:hypothetical protein